MHHHIQLVSFPDPHSLQSIRVHETVAAVSSLQVHLIRLRMHRREHKTLSRLTQRETNAKAHFVRHCNVMHSDRPQIADFWLTNLASIFENIFQIHCLDYFNLL